MAEKINFVAPVIVIGVLFLLMNLTGMFSIFGEGDSNLYPLSEEVVCSQPRLNIGWSSTIPSSLPGTRRDDCSDRMNEFVRLESVGERALPFGYVYKRLTSPGAESDGTQPKREIWKDGIKIHTATTNDFSFTHNGITLGKSGNIFFNINSVADVSISNEDLFAGDNDNEIHISLSPKVDTAAKIYVWAVERQSNREWEVAIQSITLTEGQTLNLDYPLPIDMWPSTYDLGVVIVSNNNNFQWALDCEQCSFPSGQSGRIYGERNLLLTPAQSHLFGISTKPIRIPKQPSETCTDAALRLGFDGGYSPHLGISETLCMRNDLADVPCTIIVCPVDYTCGSSGVCDEPIYQNTGCSTDNECQASFGENAVCGGTGLCWVTEIIETEVQIQKLEESSGIDIIVQPPAPTSPMGTTTGTTINPSFFTDEVSVFGLDIPNWMLGIVLLGMIFLFSSVIGGRR